MRRVSKTLAGVLFLVFFAGLFAFVGIVEGVGHPSVPAGDVALVTGVPDGSVSQGELRHAMLQQAAGSGLKKVPGPGSEKYKELQKKAQEALINSIWVRGEGEELGITITQKQIATELANIREQNFGGKAAFKEFLKKSHLSKNDVIEQVRLQILDTQIQEQVTKKAPQPSSGEVSDYYNEVKAAQYTTKPSRDVRVIVTEKKGDATKAKAILAKDNSSGSWKKVAAKYSTDPTSKSKGGLLEGVEVETLQDPLKSAILHGRKGEVVGPLKYLKNFFVLQVAKRNPGKVQTLAEVGAQIKSQLAQTLARQVVGEFISDFQIKWQSRTFCAEGFVIERCSNYVGSGHLSTAPSACYEANPKTPAKECPAPVPQVKPAIPGTVMVLKPTGEQLAQRPQPVGLAKQEEEKQQKGSGG